MPYYYGMPEFDENEPQNYIVYDVYETPTLFACNEFKNKEYTVTVNIFTLHLNTALNNLVESKFLDAKFLYDGGGQIGNDKQYPYKLQHYKEFKIDLEE